MTNIDWNTLSLEDLKKIQKDATKAIASFEARKRKEALALVEAKAAELGFSLSDLMGGAKTKTQKSAPKYCHPENPTMTWTGRGRQPSWIKDALTAGEDLETFLIVK